MFADPRDRRCVVLRGPPAETLTAALSVTARLLRESILWVGDGPEGASVVQPREVPALLGRAFAAVVVAAHRGLDPDLLAQCHGFVIGGGALVLRLGETLPDPDPRLAAFPYPAAAVGLRFEQRVRRQLPPTDLTPIAPPPPIPSGTPEQRALVARLGALLVSGTGHIALTADRGRGKSSALGLALALAVDARPDLDFVISAESPEAVMEVFRFIDSLTSGAPKRPHTPALAATDLSHDPRWCPLSDLLAGPSRDLVVIDEAARVPVPVLDRLAARHRRLVLATTVHGYEGTGRGFLLRFLPRFERRAEVSRLTLEAPIRWAPGCPLEQRVADLLLLSAEPAPVSLGVQTSAGTSAATPALTSSKTSKIETKGSKIEHLDSQDDIRFERLDRDELARDESRLGDLFGLLVHAHYRTTPSDLRRILDAPNLAIHAALMNERVVAACLVALEGGLDAPLCDAVARGNTRLRAHALADALVAHLGLPEAGRLRMIRSVRIATHPDLRRLGLAARLVEHVHESYDADLFGTLFGASPDLIAFRRTLGYRQVRVSSSRNSRTGEPSVMMLRPVSDAARNLVAQLEARLAEEWPAQRALLESDGLLLDPELVTALGAGLPPASPATAAQDDARVAAYLAGPQTFETLAATLARWVSRRDAALMRLPRDMRALVEARVLAHTSWETARARAGIASLPAAMRLLRRAIARMSQAEAQETLHER
jgi:tRNA(Met) cytidine acetyltransferase